MHKVANAELHIASANIEGKAAMRRPMKETGNHFYYINPWIYPYKPSDTALNLVCDACCNWPKRSCKGFAATLLSSWYLNLA